MAIESTDPMNGKLMKGLESEQALKQHLAELDEEAPAEDPERPTPSAQQEIAALRREVTELRERLAAIRAQVDGVPAPDERPWLRVAGTIVATFVLGKLFQRMRLGTAGAAAVPLIVAQANGRIW